MTATVAWAVVGPVLGRSLDFDQLFFLAGSIDDVFPACSVTNGIVTAPDPGNDCNIQPAVQTVTVYKMALCVAKPSAPTVLAAASLTGCSTIFESTSATGSPVDIDPNVVASLPNGTVTKPANGTYNYLYVELDPEVKIKASVRFASAIGDSNGFTTGAYCWSTGATTYNFSNNLSGSMPQATACGSSAPGAGSVSATSSLYNSAFNDVLYPPGTGFVYSFVNLPTTAGGLKTMDAYLINADGKIPNTQTVNTMGDVKRVSGILTLPAPGMTVSDATTKIVLGYNNSKGAQIATQAGPLSTRRLTKFGNGPFDMTVTAQ